MNSNIYVHGYGQNTTTTLNPFASSPPVFEETTSSMGTGNAIDGAFRFAEKRGRLDWRGIEEVNVDKMILDTDLDKLERHLQNVTYA
jgi:Iguana/Dzip1-like DAZ-interacting protein N-terminal